MESGEEVVGGEIVKLGEAGASRCDLLPLLLRTTTSTRGLLGRYYTVHSLLTLLPKPGDLKVLQVYAVYQV